MMEKCLFRMKKKRIAFSAALCVLLAVMCIFCTGCIAEEFDYDEAVLRYEQAGRALWKAYDWNSVVVPWGVWEIGRDIPAGKWRIEAATDTSVEVVYSDRVQAGGAYVYISEALFEEYIKSPNNLARSSLSTFFVEIDMRSGSFLQIKYSSARLIPMENQDRYRFPAGSTGDFAGESYEEIVSDRESIKAQIMQSDAWKEIVLPIGRVTVGPELAGKWKIEPVSGGETNIDMGSPFWALTSPENEYFDPTSRNDSVTMELEEGMTFDVEAGEAVLTSYIGKKDVIFE